MDSESSETIGRTSSRGTSRKGYSAIPVPVSKPKRARAGTNRGNLELDQPLDRIEPPLQVVYSPRQVVYPPTQRTGVKRSFWCNTIFGLIMIAVLVFGSLFGVIYSVIQTKGALKEGGTPEFNTNYDDGSASTPFIATTLVPSSFSTLVPSSYSTLVPTEITVYIESQAITSVNSEATTLVKSLITITQRDAASSVKIANNTPNGLIKKGGDVTSTAGLTMSITTTVIIRVYSTTFGHYGIQSEVNGTGESQQTCGYGAQNPCILTTSLPSDSQSTFATSTIATVSASTLDVNFTTTATDGSDTTAAIGLTTTKLPDGDVDKVTITYSVSMVCAMTDVSSMLNCKPLPTGWYISPSAPRATSVLHPLFRFISSCSHCIRDGGPYQFLRHVATTVWKHCTKAFVSTGAGGVPDNIPILLANRGLKVKVWERIIQLAEDVGAAPQSLLPTDHSAVCSFVPLLQTRPIPFRKPRNMSLSPSLSVAKTNLFLLASQPVTPLADKSTCIRLSCSQRIG